MTEQVREAWELLSSFVKVSETTRRIFDPAALSEASLTIDRFIDSRTITPPTAEWDEAMRRVRKEAHRLNIEGGHREANALLDAASTLTAIHTADRAEAKAQEALAFAAGAEEGRAWAATEIARLTAEVERLTAVADTPIAYCVRIDPHRIDGKTEAWHIDAWRERYGIDPNRALPAEEGR